MFALRSLARTAPRSAARLCSKAALRQTAVLQPTWTQAVPRLSAAFHVSAARRQESSAVSDELVAKLQSEMSLEQDMQEDEDLSTNIKEYLENSPFEVSRHPSRVGSPAVHPP